MELLAFLDFHQPHVVAIQETKIDSSIATSELFPETCPYSVYRKDRNIHGGGVMLLVHKDISHMPITELENDSETVWVKMFANKTSHFVASWYRPPGSNSEESQLFREQLDYIRTQHKGKKNLPSVHVLGDFNFKDIDWPDRKWGMRFQPVKCNMMQLTRKRIKKIHASYTLEGIDLENVESIKYLGVPITSDLRWNTQVSNVCTNPWIPEEKLIFLPPGGKRGSV